MICTLIFLIGQIFFLINIQFPRGHSFDEFHYVPSAKQYLELKENQNYEHPPLGKELIALGIGLWGDRPIGWRFMSTVFGSLTLVGMFLWAFALFRNESIALWTAGITLVNQLLYVQARIGMLDTFMLAFIVFAMAAFTATWEPLQSPKRTRFFFLITGISLGLALATKWFAVIPWALCLVLIVIVRIFQSWEICFEKAETNDWYHPSIWKEISTGEFAFYLIVLPMVTYYATFFPALIQKENAHSLWDILTGMQARMWDGQSRVVGSHPYLSHWTDWALMKRPIWYAYDKEGPSDSQVRGVLLLGNPLVMWSGIIAILICGIDWLKKRRRDAMLIFLSYSAFYLSWSVIPRKVSFYYYYYPAGMTLSLALAYVFHRFETSEKKWFRIAFFGLAAVLFIYFFPILAGLKIPANGFTDYMWLSSWI